MFSENKAQHLGNIYRLVEQFELISRTDLAKLTGLAPASVTNLTKILIDNHFILERTVQNTLSRGRPSIGLSVSNFFWQLLCITIAPQKIEISLCKLDGTQICSDSYAVFTENYANLDDYIARCAEIFNQTYSVEEQTLLAVSICVVGKVDTEKNTIIQLGNQIIHCAINYKLQQLFQRPVLLNEHFKLWLLAESTVGSLISQNNAIFLQLDDTVNLSVLLNGNLLYKQTKMNIDTMLMPIFSRLSDEIHPELDTVHRYQLVNQVTFPAIAKLVDKYFPNKLNSNEQKIALLCEKIDENQTAALEILEHISNNLAYALMNLVNLFSSEKIMLNSPLNQVKKRLFTQISQKLHQNLLQSELKVDLVTSRYSWNSTLIASSAIKQGIYNGNLIKNSIS